MQDNPALAGLPIDCCHLSKILRRCPQGDCLAVNSSVKHEASIILKSHGFKNLAMVNFLYHFGGIKCLTK
jgi:hypothetical protein